MNNCRNLPALIFIYLFDVTDLKNGHLQENTTLYAFWRLRVLSHKTTQVCQWSANDSNVSSQIEPI